MCGIAGILSRAGNTAADQPALERMLGGIRHRGPDDQGMWQSPGGHAAFAHTRLAILDLSAAGHQPMSSRDGRYTITFNGEIYNFAEIRTSLERRGHTFETRTDTEVLLQAYAADGVQCLSQMRGMFAFAVWDNVEQTCVLARDRFGIKPLYYYVDDRRLVFGSEVRTLLQSGLVPRELDVEGLYGYFLTGTVPEPRTLVRHVRSLEAATVLTWNPQGQSLKRYWCLKFGSELSGADAIEQTRRALVDSVTHHFVSDAPVGVFLSGGIDSTALVALAAEAGQRNVHTFSLAFPGESADEGVIARQTAFHFGTTHTEWAIDAVTGRELFKGFLNAGDQPSIDGLNTFAISKLAREHGMKVVLSGLGSDELFGGYPSFEQVPKLHDWNRRLALLGPLRNIAGRQLGQHGGNPRLRRLGDLLQEPPSISQTYQMFRGVFTHAEAGALVEHYAGVTLNLARAENESELESELTPRDAVSRLELTRYMRNQPLRDSDTMSMAWGLELRVPFLDGPLVDTVCAISAAERLQAGKRLLLQAVPELPSWVVNQPKRGFMFPFEKWLATEWSEMFAEIDRACPVATQTWYRKWSLFVLNRWLDQTEVMHG